MIRTMSPQLAFSATVSVVVTAVFAMSVAAAQVGAAQPVPLETAARR
jgi:hypothetical protein